MEVFNISGIYTGFSIGGLMAKGIGSYFNVPSVAFESLNFYHSGFDAAMSRFFMQKGYLTNGFQMINVYSPSQLFAQIETNSSSNFELPLWKGLTNMISPYEATCLIMAGCSIDARYDDYCDSIMGIEQYKYLYTLWNRTRYDL